MVASRDLSFVERPQNTPGVRFQGNAVSNAVQPTAERLVLADGADLAAQDQERGLKRIVGVGGLAGNAPAGALDHRPVSCEQDLKRLLVATLSEPCEQLDIRVIAVRREGL